MKPLVLVGGGGHCRSVIDVIEECGLPIAGIIDPMIDNSGCGYPMLGGDDNIPEFVGTCNFVITLGSIKDASKRATLYNLVKNCGGKFSTICANTAHVSKHATLGDGSVVLNLANINAGVEIGENCIINSCANIEHDVVIGKCTHVSTGAMINGGCKIGDMVFVGSGAVLNNGVSVCDRAIVASGAVVVHDITEPGIYVGSPAKKI